MQNCTNYFIIVPNPVIYQMVASVNQIYKTEGICKMWIGMKPLVLLYRPDDVEVKFDAVLSAHPPITTVCMHVLGHS